MKLILPSDLRARIEQESRAAFPRECCGLIEGECSGGTTKALALHPARNIAPARDRFEIDPEDHFAALKAARAKGSALIGCYHSHPDGRAAPSATDLAGAGEEDFLWLVAALNAADGPVTLGGFVYSAAVFLPAELISAWGADLVTSSAKARG
jgi:proteasome lid subunit RPN8/RPN11